MLISSAKYLFLNYSFDRSSLTVSYVPDTCPRVGVTEVNRIDKQNRFCFYRIDNLVGEISREYISK